MLAFGPDTASACQVRSLWNRSSIPGRLPLHNPPPPPAPTHPHNPYSKSQCGGEVWSVGVCAKLPPRSPSGLHRHTRLSLWAHARPASPLWQQGEMSNEDNEAMMRIYEAEAAPVRRDTTLSLSHVASCGSTSISWVTQAVADHRGVCSGRWPQCAANPATPRYSWRHAARSSKANDPTYILFSSSWISWMNPPPTRKFYTEGCISFNEVFCAGKIW